MTIDLAVVGKELQTLPYAVTPKDVMLYNLGIGATAEEQDLRFVYEKKLEAIPSFGVVPPFDTVVGMVGAPGVDIDMTKLLHGEQYLEIRKYPIPTKANLLSKPMISAVYDKGKAALIELDVETVDEEGDVVFFNKFALFVRGEGGFGGEKGPDAGYEAPDRAPDKTVQMKTLPQQGLIYRLSGDYNPLHADPGIANKAGFDRPILHGLCTFGFAVRSVLGAYCENDPARFKAIKVRFSRHVFPGETIVTEMWQTADDMITLRSKVAERDEYCLTNAAVWINK